ncbi:uncharacterized protein LOC124349664 [Daphnia pulicaria]|uniref:uncharacterized protein LOC124349664 n=1 Tax=Daphnia pulicaria TaxID=35523 RepID=UPI001EEAF5E9|nr:uncharacterized protein LOC124349664 [Daphnia pulicaria]
MRRSLYGILLLVCCCAISSVCAAPSSAVIGNELNGLARNINGTSTDLDSEDTDENPLAVAWLVARYGCVFARATAVVCKFLRTGDIGEMMLVGRSDNEELDQIDWNQVRNAVKKYGCPVIKAFAFACISIG